MDLTKATKIRRRYEGLVNLRGRQWVHDKMNAQETIAVREAFKITAAIKKQGQK